MSKENSTNQFESKILDNLIIQNNISELAKYINASNVNHLDEYGFPPIISAAFNGKFEVFKWLFSLGADLKIRCEKPSIDEGRGNFVNISALIAAGEGGNIEIVKFLEDQQLEDFNQKTDSGRTILHFAVFKKNIALINYILSKKDINLEIKDCHGYTPFRWAIYSNDFGVISRLTQEEINLNSQSNTGRTALIDCLRNKRSIDIVNLLLEKKVDLNLQDVDGKSALHHGIESNFQEGIKLLCKQGADANLIDNQSETALTLAIKNPNNISPEAILEIISILIENSTNINLEIKNKSGQTVLKLAFDKGLFNVAKYLVLHNANIDELDLKIDNIIQGLKSDNIEEIEFFLEIANKKIINFKNILVISSDKELIQVADKFASEISQELKSLKNPNSKIQELMENLNILNNLVKVLEEESKNIRVSERNDNLEEYIIQDYTPPEQSTIIKNEKTLSDSQEFEDAVVSSQEVNGEEITENHSNSFDDAEIIDNRNITETNFRPGSFLDKVVSLISPKAVTNLFGK